MTNLALASLIWFAESTTAPDTYYRFRKTFTVSETTGVVLEISADSDYAVYVNGKRVPITQFPDFPERKTYATTDISAYLVKGDNQLAVRVHHIGHGFFTHFPCEPGLLVAVTQGETVLAKTDDSWKASADPCFVQGRQCTVSPQLGFVFGYDARQEDGWLAAGYDDSAWPAAAVKTRPCANGHWRELEPRPIPFLQETAPHAVTLTQQGFYRSDEAKGSYAPHFVQETFEVPAYAAPNATRVKQQLSPDGEAWQFKQPAAGFDGVYAIFDLGEESTGYMVIDVEAAAGTHLAIHHGEHLDDGQTRSLIGGRTFIDTYICKDGRNQFTYPLRRLGCRYLQLVFTGYGDKLPAIHFAGLTDVHIPLPQASGFDCPDALQNTVRDLAIRTLWCCMHDHYEDCPWREQSLYAYDSRNQMLYGYYIWGNYDYAKASLELLGRSYLGNGYLQICAPAISSITIPSFTMVWIPMLWEHYRFSGSLEQYRRQKDIVEKILTAALQRKSSVDGLYEPGNEKNIWNFFEWTGRLAGRQPSPDSLYNIYFYEALCRAADLAREDGDSAKAKAWHDAAAKLGAVIEAKFWDENSQCYGFFLPASEPKQEHYEHVQSLMLFNNLVPAAKQDAVVKSLINGQLVGSTFSSLPYLVRALMDVSPEARKHVEERLNKAFNVWALNGFTTLPETPTGPDDFYWAGSCCHGWSAIPAYFANCCRLGVYPVEPGFTTFTVKPYPGSLLEASGSVPTPKGPIAVSWKRLADGLHVKVKAPKGTKPQKAQFTEYPIAEFIVEQ